MFTEEKAFGGHLSFRQVAYIVVAIILLGVIFFCMPSLPLAIRLFLALPVTGLGWSMAFLMLFDVGFDHLLVLSVKYLFRIKNMGHQPVGRSIGSL
jgi:hypothetical protein